MYKEIFKNYPEMDMDQIFELLMKNENKRIELYDFLDGSMVFYSGKKDYFVFSRPNELVLLDSVAGAPLYDCRRNEDCIDIIEGRDDCEFFESMSYCLIKLTE